MKQILVFIFLGFLLPLQAQKGWEVGGWAGVSHYFGDLNTSMNLSKPGVAFGAIGRYNFNTRTCAKVSLNYGFIRADDADSRNNFEVQRNLSFQSHLLDLTAQLEFNFLPYIHGSQDAYYTPYILAGFTIFNYNPTTELDGQRYALRDMGTEGQFLGDEYNIFSTALFDPLNSLLYILLLSDQCP